MTTSLGARLRAAREQHGLSLTTIADQTKIKLSLLEGLERDDVSHWPGGIFRRAWVRAYAQRVGLDGDAVVREFLVLYPENEPTPEMLAAALVPPGQRSPMRLRFLLGSALDALAGRRSGAGSSSSGATGAAADAPTEIGPERSPARPVPEPLAWADDRPAAARTDRDPDAGRSLDFHLTPPPDDVTLDAVTSTPRAAAPVDLGALATLCLRLSCATDLGQVVPVLDAARGILQASGVVLWVRVASEQTVAAVLTSGYPADLLAQLPRVPESSDIPVARAVTTGEPQLVPGHADATGAVAMPLLQPSGPVGVLAVEWPAGLERDPQLHAATRILAAQLASLLAG